LLYPLWRISYNNWQGQLFELDVGFADLLYPLWRISYNNWQGQLFELDVGFADLLLSALADKL
jgi:hypothetical protein